MLSSSIPRLKLLVCPPLPGQELSAEAPGGYKQQAGPRSRRVSPSTGDTGNRKWSVVGSRLRRCGYARQSCLPIVRWVPSLTPLPGKERTQVMLACPALIRHLSPYISAPVPKTLPPNWTDISKITVHLLANALTSKDSVIHLLVIQSLMKQTVTYKSKLISCSCSMLVTLVVSSGTLSVTHRCMSLPLSLRGTP